MITSRYLSVARVYICFFFFFFFSSVSFAMCLEIFVGLGQPAGDYAFVSLEIATDFEARFPVYEQ